MHQSPQRPFVPRVTPTRAQQAVVAADFAISPPFIPGADRARVAAFRREYAAEILADPLASLPTIEAFLDREAPALYPRAAEAPDDAVREALLAEEDELPPVEHFIDPLPAIGDFAGDGSVEAERDARALGETASDENALASASAEWGETDWQQYDWRSAAALGEPADSEASTAWATTDWDATGPRKHVNRPTPAQAIASALDQIAQQIREGELPIGGTAADPGSIAASLAALLRVNR